MMEKLVQKQMPITYSNEVKPTTTGYLFSALFGVPAICSVILGIYLASMDGDWWVLAFFVPVAVILGFFAYTGLPIQRKVIYRYELDDERILEQWENTKTGETKQKIIPYTQVNKVLIGINPVHIIVRNSSMNGSLRYYRFEAILFILHGDGMFIETFSSARDLENWIDKLKDKVSITYTQQDLSQALRSRGYVDIDFSEVEGSSNNIVSEHVGKELSNNPFPAWMPEGVQEDVEETKAAINRSNTKKAEKWTSIILFFYAIISAALILPGTPLDADGLIEFTDAILLGYLGVNLLIPCILVFFRQFSKWYNPIVFFLIVSIGNMIGIFLVSFFSDFPSMYGSIFLLNFFNLILWTCSMIGAKLIKLLFRK